MALRIAFAIIATALLAACGRSDAQTNFEPPSIREARPTFTPTAMAPVQAPAPAPEQNREAAQAVAPENQAAVPTGAKAIINDPLVNVRTGPGTEYEIVTIVERGQEFDIIAKNGAGDWWQICCIEEKTAWVIDQLVDTIGPVDQVPGAGPEGLTVARPAAPAAAPPTAVPPTPVPPTPVPPTPVPAVVQPTPAPATNTSEPEVAAPAAPGGQPFELANQEQFPEPQVVRVYLYVTNGSQGLADYSLRVAKDGGALATDAKTFGGPPGFTWPFQDARQRSQNMKIEFPGIAAGGVWEFQLIDSAGTPVGPVALFTLEANDPNQELYILYKQK